jgi:hypothetical protein
MMKKEKKQEDVRMNNEKERRNCDGQYNSSCVKKM